MKNKETTPLPITDRLIKTICERLAENKRVRRTLPPWGRVHIDRQLPFLCIYRQRRKIAAAQTERLIMGEASYLTASGNRQMRKGLSLLVNRIARTLAESFGSFLIAEIWEAPVSDSEVESSDYHPSFRILCHKNFTASATVTTLAKALKEIKVRTKAAEAEVVPTGKTAPPGLPPFLSSSEAARFGCHIIGIEVRPVYCNRGTGEVFPLVLRELHRGFARALRRSFFEFTRSQTTQRPPHYQSLGRWSMVKAVWEVDRQLAEVNNGFDFLLQVTPTNPHAAWTAFKRKGFESAPEFIYRPLPIDPGLTKRRLFGIPIERIEDPTLAQLFREQQMELDRKLTMMIDRNTPSFMYGSLQLYGEVDESLMKLAGEILEQLPARSRDESPGGSINARDFAARAVKEIAYFRQTLPDIRTQAIVREDISGLMVSQGNLLIGKHTKIPVGRIEALIQHEVGTHVLTYLNGQAQPFRQLYVGLSGYEELQEGLAVLSEYLVGGLTRPRLRLLAARVLAARRLVEGASFVEVFRELDDVHNFERRTAFNITMRTFRCGGLIKDAIYLRGLVQLLDYLKQGGMLEPLFVGKIAASHVAIIQELQWRKVLRPPPLCPRYLDDPQTAEKLKGLRNGLSILTLVKRRKK